MCASCDGKRRRVNWEHGLLWASVPSRKVPPHAPCRDPAGVSTDAADVDDAGVVGLRIVLRLTASKKWLRSKGIFLSFCKNRIKIAKKGHIFLSFCKNRMKITKKEHMFLLSSKNRMKKRCIIAHFFLPWNTKSLLRTI